jgi:hypothetical protein
MIARVQISAEAAANPAGAKKGKIKAARTAGRYVRRIINVFLFVLALKA